MWRSWFFLILLNSQGVLAQSINKDFMYDPSYLTPEISGLILSQEMNSTNSATLQSTLSKVKRDLEGRGDIPTDFNAFKEIDALNTEGAMRFYGFKDEAKFKQFVGHIRSFQSSNKKSQPTFDQIMQTIFARLQGQIDMANSPEEIKEKEEQYEELSDLYGTLLNQIAAKVSKVNQYARSISEGSEDLFELSQNSSNTTASATLNALYDGLGAYKELNDRKEDVEQDKGLYQGMLYKTEYLELIEDQNNLASELADETYFAEKMEEIVDLSKSYDAIEEYEEPVARQVIGTVTQVFSIAGSVADKNPFSAIAGVGELTLSIYDTTQGGAPEEHRHNEMRARLSALVEGQKLILSSVQELGLRINEKLKLVMKKLDNIQSIVLASQRLIIDLGFKGLRDCEKFSEAKQYYVKTDSTGPRLDLGYASYDSFRSHFMQSELNRYFHNCFDFLNDVVSTREGLSLLSTLQNPSDAELIARQLGQSVAWVNKQMTSHQTSLGKMLNFVKRNIDPKFLPSFLGAMSVESAQVSSLDVKLASIKKDMKGQWADYYQDLDLDKNLNKLYNPYTVLKMSEYVRMIQDFRMYMDSSGDELVEKSDLMQLGHYPLNEFNGSSSSQQFDHFTSVMRKTDRLLAVTTAQQNLHSGDLLIPVLATIGLSNNFQRWADKQPEKAKLKGLMTEAKALFKDNRILRENVVFYKIKRYFRGDDLPDLKEFIQANPMLPGETEKEWEVRIVAKLKQIAFKPYYDYIATVKEVAAIIASDYSQSLQNFAIHLEKQLEQSSIERIFEGAKSVRKTYIKHLTIDVFEKRGSQPVGEAFYKKRWGKLLELTHALVFGFDLDYVNFAKDVLFIDQEKKRNPRGFDKTLRRDGSRLYLPLATNLAKRFKDQELVGVHFPSVSALKEGKLTVTRYNAELKTSRRLLLQKYMLYYSSLWQSDKARRVQKYNFGSAVN